MNKVKRPGAPRRRQQGGIAVFAAIGIGVLVSMLALLDIGFMYHYKREYQKAADLAAMAGASQLDEGCDEAKALAVASAATNLTVQWASEAFAEGGVRCGVLVSRVFEVNEGPEATAVRVIISGTPPRFFLPTRRIVVASAIASSGDPVAAFSVGTRLARLSGNSVVGDTLQMIGLDPERIDVMGYNGLVDAVVTPRGILAALGIPVSADLTVADFNQLLSVQRLTLGQVMDATLIAAGREDLIALNTVVLNALRPALGVPSLDSIVLPLGSGSGTTGLFAPIEAGVASALDVSVNALDLITTAITVASSRRGIDIETTRLDIPGLGTVTVKAGVIEPPAIGIGGPGTRAYSAQTRIFAHINLSTDNLAGGLLNILGTQLTINLPITIDVASAMGVLDNLCTADLKSLNRPSCPLGQDCAVIDVDMQAAKICIGSIQESALFSDSSSCDLVANNDASVRLRIAGLNLVNMVGLPQPYVDIGSNNGASTLAQGFVQTLDSSLGLGESVRQLTDAFLAGVLAEGLISGPAMSQSYRHGLAKKIWQQHGGGQCGLLNVGCRHAALTASRESIEGSIDGLSKFMTDVIGGNQLVRSVLSLDVVGIINLIVGGVDGLLSGLGDVACTLVSNDMCINQLANSLNNSYVSGDNAIRSGNAFLSGLILPVLKPILDAVGDDVLMPLLEDVLGLQVGQTDVAVMDIQCRDGAHLVH